MRMGPCSTPRAEVDYSAGYSESSQSAFADSSAVLRSINVKLCLANRLFGPRECMRH